MNHKIKLFYAVTALLSPAFSEAEFTPLQMGEAGSYAKTENLYRLPIIAPSIDFTEYKIYEELYFRGEEGSNKAHIINTASSISSYIDSELPRHKNTTDNLFPKLFDTLMPFIEKSTRLALYSDKQVASILSVYEARTEDSLFSEIKEHIRPAHLSTESNLWKIDVTVITTEGAIERRSYEGRWHPFSIDLFQVRLLAPVNTVPEIGYSPGVEDLDVDTRKKSMDELQAKREESEKKDILMIKKVTSVSASRKDLTSPWRQPVPPESLIIGVHHPLPQKNQPTSQP